MTNYKVYHDSTIAAIRFLIDNSAKEWFEFSWESHFGFHWKFFHISYYHSPESKESSGKTVFEISKFWRFKRACQKFPYAHPQRFFLRAPNEVDFFTIPLYVLHSIKKIVWIIFKLEWYKEKIFTLFEKVALSFLNYSQA